MKKNRFKSALWSVLFIVGAFLCGSAPSHAVSFGGNIISNGGAEEGRAFTDGRLVKVKKWQIEGGLTASQYGKDPNFLPRKSPGSKKRGKNYFAGGLKNPLAKATKIVNVSSIAKAIDKSSISFKLSGYFGGWTIQNDNAVLTAEFLNAAKQPISQVSIGSVLAAERANISKLLPRNLRGVIPAGTRSIRIVLTMIRVEGDFNDGYADDLSMVLKKKR